MSVTCGAFPEAAKEFAKVCDGPKLNISTLRNIPVRRFFGASPFFFDLVLSVTLAATTRAVCSYFDA